MRRQDLRHNSYKFDLKKRVFFVFLYGNLFLEKKMWVVMVFVGSELQSVLDYLEVNTQETHPVPSHFLSCQMFQIRIRT